mgnify:CR=1 FL=1
MNIINGSGKNSSANSKIRDRRTLRVEDFIKGQSEKQSFALPEIRNWLFDILVGAAIIQLNPGNEDYYVSAVMHAATTKAFHKEEIGIIEDGLNEMRMSLEEDIRDKDVEYFIKASYQGLRASVGAYDVLTLPPLDDVYEKVACISEDGELEGLVTEVDIKEVNSDSDIMKLLNDDGELRLETSVTIFVGGQVLDRGITIPNMINFFYGRDPKTMQQDTVVQHCRMFGYRAPELLSVTRFYTTYRLFSNMQEITIRDSILRKRISSQKQGNVVYLEAGGDIKACSPAKVLASKINNVLPEKRYLPVGFEIKRNKKKAQEVHDEILDIIKENRGLIKGDKTQYRKGRPTDGTYVTISPDTAMKLIRLSYSIMDPYDDGTCNEISQIEPPYWFSISEGIDSGDKGVALIVREKRTLGKMKHDGTMYQDGPDDGNNEGALAKELREKMPVLVLTEQTNPEWRYNFWWPVYYTPNDMNIGIYAEVNSKSGIVENLANAAPRALIISEYYLVDRYGIDADLFKDLSDNIGSVTEYRDRMFGTSDIEPLNKKRKEIKCPIYIDAVNPMESEDVVNKNLTRIHKKVQKILVEGKISDEDSEKILQYFDDALEGAITDDVREDAIKCIDASKFKKYQKAALNGLLKEVDEIVYRKFETMGYCIPAGSGKCELHIYYETINKELDEPNQDVAIRKICKYTMAHEMFHAMHYADVMTESGRWIYTRKDYLKQSAIQETLAEYFSFCFSKDVIDRDGDDFAEKYIRTIREKNKFPEDGGYSGALIMESLEQSNKQHGFDNTMCYKVYEESLGDMPRAYRRFVSGALK